MPVWVQLFQPMHIEERGKLRQYQRGDWVKVGKQLALQWVAAGQCQSPFPETVAVEEPEGTSGLMVFGRTDDVPELGIDVADDGLFELRWHKTAFWQSAVYVNPALFAVGFGLINRWEIALPLWDYRHLARDETMDDDEREYTQRIIRDLRVPLYDIRLMFVRRCENTRRLLEVWEGEGEWTRLSFLRSLYRVKPLVLALPVTWTGQYSPTNS